MTEGKASARRRLTHAEWKAEAIRRFGDDPNGWRFTCPSCGHVATVKDWKDAGAPDGSVAFACVGRWLPDQAAAFPLQEGGSGPCNYSGGGLFRLNPVEVEFPDGAVMEAFEFGDLAPAHATALRRKGDALDFPDLTSAERWLQAHGYVYGPMQREDPIGVQPAAAFEGVSKWRNLTKAQRAACAAVLRVGPAPVGQRGVDGEPYLQVADRPWRLTFQHAITETTTIAPVTP